MVELGSSRYNVAAGRSATVNVRLVSGVRSLADRKGNIKVLAVATTGASGNAASSSRHLTLALGSAPKKR